MSSAQLRRFFGALLRVPNLEDSARTGARLQRQAQDDVRFELRASFQLCHFEPPWQHALLKCTGSSLFAVLRMKNRTHSYARAITELSS
eukprot:5348971-Amphidinium_carterae.1